MSSKKIHRRRIKAPIPFAERLKYENLKPDLWFDPYLQLSKDHAEALLEEIGAFEPPRKRVRSERENGLHIQRFGSLAANALAGEHQERPVALARGSCQHLRSDPFSPEFLSSRPMRRLQDRLADAGMLDLNISKAYGPEAEKQSPASTFAGTEAFLEAAGRVAINAQSIVDRIDERAVIHMKNEKKERIGFDPENPYLKRRSHMLKQMNRNIQEHEIVTQCERKNLPKVLNSSCYAVYNQGSVSHGGRIFGGLWQTEKSSRRHLITIDGYKCLEPDFPSFQPGVLYAWSNAHYDGDHYDIPALEHYLIGKGVPLTDVRKRIKHAMVALINLRSRHGWHFVDLGWTEKYDICIGEVFNLIEAHHPAIKHHFCKSIGFQLMNTESMICESVIEAGLREGILVLSIHDSFLVQEDNADWLMRTMERKYELHVGRKIEVRLD